MKIVEHLAAKDSYLQWEKCLQMKANALCLLDRQLFGNKFAALT